MSNIEKALGLLNLVIKDIEDMPVEASQFTLNLALDEAYESLASVRALLEQEA